MSSSFVSFLFLQCRQSLHISLFPSSFASSPRLLSLPGNQRPSGAPTLEQGHGSRRAPPPPAASAARRPRGHPPSHTLHGQMRAGKDRNSGPARHPPRLGAPRGRPGGGGGDGGEEGGGKAPTSSRSSPAEVSLFVCGFAPGPRASFPGISSFRKRGRAGRCKVRAGGAARGAVRGSGPGLAGAGDNRRGSARAPPPSPLPPPPAAAAAAAAPVASSPRYCCKSSFLPPHPPPAGASGTPSPPRARAPPGWQERGPQGAERASGPGRRARRAEVLAAARSRGACVGEGDPEFFGKRWPGAGRGWSPSLGAPCPGFSGLPGGGATPSRLELSRNHSCHSGRGLRVQASSSPIFLLRQLRPREKESLPQSHLLEAGP